MRGLRFFKGKRVFVTGHTGFKGSWLCKVLLDAEAEVTGYALEATTDPNLFGLIGLQKEMASVFGDIRDFARLKAAFDAARPELIIHLAAQPLVQESYVRPAETFHTNIMGAVNLMECVRQGTGVRSFLNVTTDKVYRNHEWVWGYRENDTLDGYDPYSNSKSCSELVTRSYRDCFFNNSNVAISTARAGNVVGGGDFAKDRIIPDCIRAAEAGRSIIVRNPHSIRPYQHVLEPIFAYLMILVTQYENKAREGCYNVGPDEAGCITTAQIAELFCKHWGEGQTWHATPSDMPHEASYLKLDCSKIKRELGWEPVWNIETAVEKTVEWTKVFLAGGDVAACMERQIMEYFGAPPKVT